MSVFYTAGLIVAGLVCVAVKLAIGVLFWSQVHADNDVTKWVFISITVATGLMVMLLPIYLIRAKSPAMDVRALFVLALCWDIIVGVAGSTNSRDTVDAKRLASVETLQALRLDVKRYAKEREKVLAVPRPEAPKHPANYYAIKATALEARGTGCDRTKEMRWRVCQQAAQMRALEAEAQAAAQSVTKWQESRLRAENKLSEARKRLSGAKPPPTGDAATRALVKIPHAIGYEIPEAIVKLALGFMLVCILEAGSIVPFKILAAGAPAAARRRSASGNDLVEHLKGMPKDGDGYVKIAQVALAKNMGVNRSQLNALADNAVASGELEKVSDPTGTLWRVA